MKERKNNRDKLRGKKANNIGRYIINRLVSLKHDNNCKCNNNDYCWQQQRQQDRVRE